MKRWMAVLMALVCLAALSACSSKEEEQTAEVLAAPAGEPDQAVALEEQDATAIFTLLYSADWNTGGAYNCENDVLLTVAGQEIYYHSECGRFNDLVNQCSYRVYDIQAEAINDILSSYVDLQAAAE